MASLAAGDIGATIGAELGISQPAVSQHLRVLRESGFATVTVAGQRRLYAVSGPTTSGRRGRIRLVVMRGDAPRRLVVRWSWPDDPDSIVDLRLAEHGGGWEGFGVPAGRARPEADWQADWEIAVAVLRP